MATFGCHIEYPAASLQPYNLREENNLMLTDTKIKINLEEKYLLAVNQIVMPNAIDDD